MEPTSNRKFVWTALLSITILKIGMAIHGYLYNPLSIFSLALFLALDATVFLLFKNKHIPKLTNLAMVLLAFGMTFVSISLFVLQSGQVFTFEDDQVVQEPIDSILNTSHILGSHTVHVRPPTIVKLNPNQTQYCLRDELVIPVMIKGTPPFYLDYSVSDKVFKNVSIGNSQAILLQKNPTMFPFYAKDERAAEKQGRKVAVYGIQVTQVGAFELLEAREQNGDQARLLANDPVQVVQCPRAKWKEIEHTNKCIDDEIHAAIEVEGVFPLSVYYVEQVGKDERVNVVQGPEYVFAGEEGVKTQVGTVDIPIMKKVDSANVYNFKLARIVDGLNNTIEFSLDTEIALPMVTMKGMYWKRQEEGDVLTVVGHGQPTIGFQKCESITIRTEYDPQFESAPTAKIPLVFEGEGPFDVELEFIPDSSMPAQPMTLSNVNSKTFDLTALEPGTFQLTSVKDRFCSGSVRMPKACHVQGVDPPTFTFSTSPIEESCFGAIGTNVELSFTGEGPFWLEYVIEKTELVKEGSAPRVVRFPRERETFSKPRSTLVLRPRDPGVYRYFFERVGDRSYDGIHIKESSLTQIIHPHSSAYFMAKGKNEYVRCIGDTVEVQVGVQGSGPWEVTYEITHGFKSQKMTRKVAENESRFTIVVDDLRTSGVYTLDLLEIKDGNGCSMKLQSDAVKIEVLPARPTVSFQSVKNIYTLEGGSALLPISLSGRGPFQIEYRNTNTNKVFKTNVQGSVRTFQVNGPGVYELVSISDSVCTGQVDDSKQIHVLTIPKPTIKVQSYAIDTVQGNVVMKPPVCIGTENGFQVDFTGKTPFKVKMTHNVIRPGAKRPVKSENLAETVDTSFLRVLFDTSIAGLHRYELETFSDGNYKQSMAIKGPNVIEQLVHDAPSATFIEPEQKVFQCTSRNKNPFELGLKLVGQPPFNIKIEQKHDNQHVQWIEKIADKDNLKVVEGGYIFSFFGDSVSTMGRHDFILDSISDATMCQGIYDRTSNPISTFVEIADQARITPYTKESVCIGDLLSYTLQGTPPFTIGYTWQGIPQTDLIVPDPMMSFWAGAEGEVVITKVCNSAGCCDESVSTDEKMKTIVRPLPKAIVDQGLDLIDDIKEGDESQFVVDFEGTPPFSFTYSRSKLGGKNNQEEVITVSDINSHRVL